MFDREIKLIGIDNYNKIKTKTVAIIGIGGVGGYAVESLTRCGIENIIIADYDKIDITNLNRQIISMQDNIGQYKVDICKERIHNINPNCNVITIKEKLNIDNLDILFKYNIDYIIDACDTLSVKQQLIIEAKKRNIKLISSMGTGRKTHPELLKVCDIRETSYDPLAKKIRLFVKQNNIKSKVMVVSSTEKPKEITDNTVSSICFVPAVAGLLCSNYVINDIIDNN